MVREYIVKIADDVTEDDDVLYGKPAKELIRCKDCEYRREWFCDLDGRYHSPNFYCANGRKDGDMDEAD